ncbi:MAG: ABC transporter permease [Clostridia bacterium]|nr:ABC transporter permease [Clostridia bacterium]
MDVIINFLRTDLRTATPILLAAIGLVFMERSGVVNIGVEGMMLVGTLFAVVGSFYFGNAWLGAITAMLATGLMGLLFAFLVVTVRANQVVVGIAINILGLGLTTSLARIVFGVNLAPPKIDTFKIVSIPFLSDIPILGPILFNQMLLVYFALLLVPITHYMLFKTTIGLKIRAVGEHPKAADTVGINVFKVRYASIIGGSLLAGLAGAYLSLGLLSFFSEGMVAGRGFIALAAVIFGKWTPFGTLGAALLFGLGDAIQIRMQAMGSTVPYQFLLMLPYLLTVVALAGFVGKSSPPAASGLPYTKE